MIKKIIIKNFENHENTVLEGFSNKLNLICGRSDTGKSSIIRAINTLAYNTFDSNCVRVGEKFCEIYIETDKGSILAQRGKNVNHWEVTPINGSKKEFNNIGKSILPEVEEILGLKLITLGDIPIKVNVMNQMESHFLMAEIGGEKASGSIRAQIIDEISGLSGIESIIKEVSTDHLRFKKESNSQEDEISKLKNKLFDEELLKEEEKLVSYFETSIKKIKKNENLISSFKDIDSKSKSIDSILEKSSNDLKNCLSDEDIEKIYSIDKSLKSCLDRNNSLIKNKTEIELINSKLINIKNEYKNIGDLDAVNFDQIQSNFVKIKNLKNINENIKLLNDKVNLLSKELAAIPDMINISSSLIENKANELKEKKYFYSDGVGVNKKLKQNKEEILQIEPEIKAIKEELENKFKEYGVCPLCERLSQ